MAVKKNKKITKIMRLIVSLLLAAGIYYFLLNKIDISLEEFNFSKINFPAIIFSFLLLLINYLIYPFYWKYLFNASGIFISYRNIYIIIYKTILYKYLPGGIWSYVGRVYLFDKAGIRKRDIVSISVVLAGMNAVFNLFIFFIVYIIFFSRKYDILLLVLLAGLVLLILLFKDYIKKLIGHILTKFKLKNLKLNVKNIIIFFLVSLCDWVIFAAGFYMLINSFFKFSINHLIIFTGISALAFFMSLYNLITPDGIGMREGVQAYLMKQFITVNKSALAAVLMRGWMIIAEIFMFLTAIFLKNCNEKEKKLRNKHDHLRIQKKEWDRNTEKYTDYLKMVTRPGGKQFDITVKNIIKYLNLKKRDRLIDVGCGSGAMQKKIIEKTRKRKYTGIDMAEKKLEKE